METMLDIAELLGGDLGGDWVVHDMITDDQVSNL